MDNKKALVTGSSRGIGRAIAISLAKDGYEVYIHCAGNVEKAEEVKKIIEDMGGIAHIIKADLCDLEQTKTVISKTNGIDVLVLNASVQYRTKWEEITVEEANDQINCNLISSLILIQDSVPYMKKKGWGRVITIGSVQETKPHPDMLIYSSSKSAQTSMVKSLAVQLAETGITVNNVAPGVILTDRNASALSNEAYKKQVLESIPMKYCGKPEDCAGIVSFLCSPSANYITGQNIFVDGGKGL